MADRAEIQFIGVNIVLSVLMPSEDLSVSKSIDNTFEYFSCFSMSRIIYGD